LSGFEEYIGNQLMKCIGFCHDTAGWPPAGTPGYCDYNEYNPPSNDGGWYWPTNEASPDYFHLNGVGRAKSPYIAVYQIGEHEYKWEYRYPCGYRSNGANYYDSAFVGIRFDVRYPDFKYYNKPKFDNYKEYIQSRLSIPLVGPSKYKVKFFVSKSIHSIPSIKKLGAYFSDTAVYNHPNFAYKYNHNLSLTNFPDPLNYISNPQICSDFRLDQTADEDGYDGWQEISGTLIVPAGKTYNYITIGNFQNDIDLYYDLDSYISGGKKIGQAYYFIDSVSIYPIDSTACECVDMMVPIEINKQYPGNDSTQCCYQYKIIIPDESARWTYKLCYIHKFQIRKGEDVLVEETANEGENFDGRNFDGSFCVEKFNTSNNEFTIIFFTRDENGEYIPLERCTKVMKLNCVCDCSNFSDYPHPKNKATLELIKVDSSASGRCCWDIVLKNPFTNDSSSCEYDLSGQYIIINSNNLTTNNLSMHNYDFTSPTIPFQDNNNYLKYWSLPTPFILKPGEEIILGSVCSYGIPPESYQNQTINFILSNYSDSYSGCDTVAKKILACDTTLLCCDNWEIRYDSLTSYTGPFYLPEGYCGAYLHLYYLNSIDYCNLLDTFNISLTTSNNIISQEFDLVPASLSSGELINISPFLIFNDSIRACVKIINKRTLDTCERCTTIYCGYMPILPNEMEQSGGELFKNSIGDLPGDLNIIKIVPHPIDNNFEIHLISRNKESSKIKIFDLMGIEVYSIDYDLIEGFNKISVNNFDLGNGTYILTITTDDKIKSSKIQIMR